jgi:quercetin dioxygenase-like cupin family protein
MRRTAGMSIAVAGIVTALIVGVAVATPPSGIVAAPIIGRGHFTDDVRMKFKVKRHGTKPTVVSMKDPSEIVAQEIMIAPDGHTGWHTHPGPAVVVVKSGAMSLTMADRACSTHDYGTGEAFVDVGRGNVHIGRNASSTEPLELHVTYFDIPAGESPRIDADEPTLCR